jgi:TonB family protein
MIRRRLRFVLGLLLVSALAPAEAEEAATSGDVVTLPKPIEPNPGRYPNSARAVGREGWVMISRCIDLAGKTVDPVVVSSSGFPDFERAALETVRDSRYEPATVNGVPVESCDQKVLLRYQLQNVQRAARPAFVSSWKKARKLIEAARIDDARRALAALDAYTSYEASQADLLWSEIYRLQGDNGRELRCLEAAMTFPEDLNPKQAARVLRRIFALQLKTQRYAEALDTYQKLRGIDAKREIDAWPADEQSVGEQLIALVDGPSPVSTDATLESQFETDGEAAMWSAKLLRRKFAFRRIVGEPERFELRCDGKHYRSEVDATTQWKVPESWGACWIYVFGHPGAAFQLVEFPKPQVLAAG